jgi:iron complex transport system substrate-binding protein
MDHALRLIWNWLNQVDAIVKNYNDALALVSSKKTYSNCFIWLPYQDQWYVAKASWVAFKDAKANYLWSNVAGTGSIGLSFEQVLEKPNGKRITTGPYKTVAELNAINPHTVNLMLLKANKSILLKERKRNRRLIYYESAASRPDLVLKDYIKIFILDLLYIYLCKKLN